MNFFFEKGKFFHKGNFFTREIFSQGKFLQREENFCKGEKILQRGEGEFVKGRGGRNFAKGEKFCKGENFEKGTLMWERNFKRKFLKGNVKRNILKEKEILRRMRKEFEKSQQEVKESAMQ